MSTMTDRSGSALPHILQEYKSGYSQDPNASARSGHKQETPRKEENENSRTRPAKQSHGERGHGKSKEKNKSGRESPWKLKSREDSNVSESRHDQQRREENYQTWQDWQEFKTINREHEFSKLKKKVALQQKLIQKRDELHAQLTEEEQQRQAEPTQGMGANLRAAEKQKKAEMEEELLKKCKESLEMDKQRKAARQAQIQALRQKREELRTAEGILPIPGPRPLSVVQSRSGETESMISSGNVDLSREETFMSMFSEGDLTESLLEELPGHKAELYRLFGARQANYFLYPRIEPEKKKKIKVNPSLRKHGGRSGANTLWSVLRSQSKVKLMMADSKIPAELKEAYGAFVRECLTQRKTVAKRSFYSETEVPESEKIQDSSYKMRVKEMRHKIEFMFRAAQLNEDKTSILLFNNPPPDFNDLEGQEGPFRYHPSWIPDMDEEEELEYKKWLKYRPLDWPMVEGEEETPKSKEITPRTDKSETKTQKESRSASRNSNGSEEESEDSDDWLINMMAHKSDEEVKEETPREKPPPKLVFLTEDMCRQPGQFRERLKNKKKKEHAPMLEPVEHQEEMPKPLPPIKAMSAVDKRKTLPFKTQGGTSPRTERSRTAPPAADIPTPRNKPGRKSDWQPLTLNALTEYKPAFPVQGEGDFKHGQGEFWKPILS